MRGVGDGEAPQVYSVSGLRRPTSGKPTVPALRARRSRPRSPPSAGKGSDSRGRSTTEMGKETPPPPTSRTAPVLALGPGCLSIKTRLLAPPLRGSAFAPHPHPPGGCEGRPHPGRCQLRGDLLRPARSAVSAPHSVIDLAALVADESTCLLTRLQTLLALLDAAPIGPDGSPNRPGLKHHTADPSEPDAEQ